jgi:prepilin-type N-terminal cleavage/methylation domain-containing protein
MRNYKYIKKSAFTLIELVFVIVVLGILAALAIPRYDRDLRQEAADNILSAIRYTKHMALIDNKTDPRTNTYPNGDWQKALWAIRFTVSTTDPDATYYTIATDENRNGSISKKESAIDPSNGKYFYNSSGSFASKANDESPNIFIGHKYGINSITFTGGCSNANKHVAFDYFGRLHNGIGSATNDYATYQTQDCNITLGFQSSGVDAISIIVEKQTGHAYIDDQPDS